MAKELRYISGAVEKPVRPFLAILGGAKVSDKILIIENLLDKVDEMIIGGGMAYTFLKFQGHAIGKSIFDEPGFQLVPKILEKAKARNVKLHLPIDFLIADKFAADAKVDKADLKTG